MTTVVAAAPAVAIPRDQGLSSLAHLAASAPPMATRTTPPGNHAPNSAEHSPRSVPRPSVEENISPKSARGAGARSVTKVKKEPPASPNPSSARPRPRRLDLSAGGPAGRGPQSARPAPLTGKDSAGLAIHDLGVACLSPGFQTQDPTMREHLQRSLDVREQQRQIIEARQKGVKIPTHETSGAAPGAAPGAESAQFNIPTRAPSSSRRKGPPPGLTINAPSAAAFSSERVIQSAPLHQSFTGLRGHAHAHQPSNLSQTSHIHHVPATQTSNRLPPISDVFAHEGLAAPPSARPPTAMFATGQSPSIGPPPLQSPGLAQHAYSQQPPHTGRSREFKSAEEAVQEMSHGREELLPKIVHYGGAQPPTPPSPMPPSQQSQHPPHPHAYPQPPQRLSPHASGTGRVEALRSEASMAGRRRPRDEYEREHGSPLGQQDAKRASYLPDAGADWRSGMSNHEKREEFLRLCSRAWDLFHS